MLPACYPRVTRVLPVCYGCVVGGFRVYSSPTLFAPCRSVAWILVRCLLAGFGLGEGSRVCVCVDVSGLFKRKKRR